jgi:GNAT superfamily N-acetyltransferase
MLTIRHATVADARAISEFGRRTFHGTFAPDNSAENIEAYLAVAFTEARQAQELADPNTVTLVAEMSAILVGYAQLSGGAAPPCVTGPSPIELVRFYVDRAWHGRGIAQALMQAVDECASDRAQTMWLGVWERNPRAMAFYAKCGFVDVGSHVFRLGHEDQTDRIMVRSLARRGLRSDQPTVSSPP